MHIYPMQIMILKIVYLTFDDGPTYLITDEILDVLQQYNVKATFFIVGKEINGKERILKESTMKDME